jgi:nucleotide-binding universal stress UspA family protein
MSEATGGILLAYDGSPDAERALEWAGSTAAREHMPVHALLIDDLDIVPAAQSAAQSPLEGRLHHLRDEVERSLKEAGVTAAYVEIRQGHVAPLIVEAAQHASLVVVGSRGHSALAEMFIGSVSQRVAREAPCPVVVLRPAAAPAANRIVVGVDGSGNSSAAIEFACRRAELTGEVVVAIHAWKMGDLPVDRAGNVPDSVGPMLDDKGVLLAEAVAGMRTAHPDVMVVRELIPVAPATALVDASQNASLVVTGSRGRGAMTGTLLGSVSNHVLHHAHCPVAIVR